MNTAPSFASAQEAAEVIRAGLGYLAATDATAMAAKTQAQCLQILEQATAMSTAARASILAAFTSGQGYSADADYSPRAWLINRTHITKAAAVAYTAWARRAAAHPQIAQALAAGEISESFARTICTWTDKKNGGKTSVRDCVLLCWFHHQVVIHRWGWTLVLNPDGTTTAWNPDKTKVLHSHGPPIRPG